MIRAHELIEALKRATDEEKRQICALLTVADSSDLPPIVKTPTRAVESFVSAAESGTEFTREEIRLFAVGQGAPSYDATAINNALQKLKTEGVVEIFREGTNKAMAVWRKL